MATRRSATLLARRELTEGVSSLELGMEGDPVRFVGGQYIIVDTGVVRDDKPIKRAYSLASPDGERDRVRLIVRRHGEGPGSNALLAASIGTELGFSGPWGKCLAPNAVETAGRCRIAVTSIGVTAALGLASSAAFAGRPLDLDLLVPAGEVPVLDEAILAAELPHVTVRRVPLLAESTLRDYAESSFDGSLGRLYLAGSGRTNLALAAHAIRLGVDPSRIACEHFFDKPPAEATPRATA